MVFILSLLVQKPKPLSLSTKSEKKNRGWSQCSGVTLSADQLCHIIMVITVTDRGYWWKCFAVVVVWLMVLSGADIHCGPVSLVLMNGLQLFCCRGKDYLMNWTSCSGSIFKADQHCVPISILSVLTILRCRAFQLRSGRKEVYWKDPDGVLKTVNPQSVDRCTLFVPNGSHLSYVVEEAGSGWANVGAFST